MNPLSKKAKEELRDILRTDIGQERVKLLNEEDIQSLGSFLLEIRAGAIKRRMKQLAAEKSTASTQGDSLD